MSTFTNYQLQANTTAIYPGKGEALGLAYVALGLAGEAGEVANKVKKILRDNDGVVTDEVKTKIADECGDVYWYLAQLATEIGYPMALIAERNLAKLADRQERGVLAGSGDTR